MTDKPTVLITGTSTGIGRATAREMRDRGWQVFATARTQQDLESLQADGLIPLELDLSDESSIDRMVSELKDATGGQLDGLVNNAGFGQPGALEDLDRGAMRRQFDVNVFGLLQLTNALLPWMIERGQGRIVHVSSVVGRVSLPFMGIYSASKFAVEALADAQRVELDGTGVQVSLIEPGPIVTEFSNNAISSGEKRLLESDSRFKALYEKELLQREEHEGPKPFALPPEAVAEKIAHALTASRPRIRYPVTLPARVGALMARFAPAGLIDFILRRELRSRR